MADAVRSHMAIGIGGDGDTDIQTRSVVLQIDIEEVRVDSMADIRRNQETVRHGLRQLVWPIVGREGLRDAFHDAAHEIRLRSYLLHHLPVSFFFIRHKPSTINTTFHIMHMHMCLCRISSRAAPIRWNISVGEVSCVEAVGAADG